MNTARQIATGLGVSPSTVTRIAKAHGIGKQDRLSWRFTDRDVKRIERLIDRKISDGRKRQ
jgi:DNA-binding MurR/RpiR family transcriptional regulator